MLILFLKKISLSIIINHHKSSQLLILIILKTFNKILIKFSIPRNMYHKTHIFNQQTLFLTSNPTIFPKYRTNRFEDGIQIPKVWTVSKQRCLEMFRGHPVYPHARDTLVLYSYSTESGIQRLVRVGTSAWCTVWCMRMRIRIMGKLVRELVWELVRYAHRRIYACGYGGGGRGQRIGGERERERDGSLHNVNPACRDL